MYSILALWHCQQGHNIHLLTCFVRMHSTDKQTTKVTKPTFKSFKDFSRTGVTTDQQGRGQGQGLTSLIINMSYTLAPSSIMMSAIGLNESIPSISLYQVYFTVALRHGTALKYIQSRMTVNTVIVFVIAAAAAAAVSLRAQICNWSIG